ncbi:MAG: hypothetical protein JST00_40825 [Deltaproteobacteria bacterium]|nr:hypothetical protein [Deltaproteobacteria bacterium]
MGSLHPCTGCARHVRGTDAVCPFCGAEVTEPAPRVATNNKRLTRAAILFATAAVAAACGGKEDPVPTTSSSSSGSSGTSGSSGSSGSSGTSGTSGVAPAYGVPDPDSGADDGGPVALYGPAPVDAGDG